MSKCSGVFECVSEKNVKPLTKSKQLIDTLKWIETNYERSDGVCITRGSVYQLYLKFCLKLQYTPIGPAAFGKVLRQHFPGLTTRRLGTRGHSKYHYHGIDLKPKSLYKVFLLEENSNQKRTKPDQTVVTKKKKREESFLTVVSLPNFPILTEYPVALDIDQINTFIVMYRAHCQRMLDATAIADFSEIKTLVDHFWHGIPPHLTSVLQSHFMVDMIVACDIILYSAMNQVLFPSLKTEIPESLRVEIESFVSDFPMWLQLALHLSDSSLKDKKIKVARKFASKVFKELKVSFLAQTCRVLMSTRGNSKRLLFDLCNVCQKGLWSRMSYFQWNGFTRELGVFFSDLLKVLEQSFSHNKLMESVNKILTDLLRNSIKKNFILVFFYFLNVLSKDLMLKNASSFGVYELLRLLLEEYGLVNLEAIAMEEYLELHLLKLNMGKTSRSFLVRNA